MRKPNLFKHTVVSAILISVASPSLAGPTSPSDETISVAIAGDTIGLSHPMNRTTDSRFAQVADLFRNADVGFANLEGAVFDLWDFPGYPAAENGGGEPAYTTGFARDLRDMGVTLVSKANNHATDWGSEGLVTTLENIRRAGITQAGAGLSASAARAPAYLATAKGPIALVATASTFPPMSIAGDAIVRRGVTTKPRPGISVLRTREVRLVPPALLASLRTAAGPLALDEGSAVRIGDQLFEANKGFGTRWDMKPSDQSELLSAVDEGKAHAKLVIFSIHAHETAGDDDKPPPLPFQPMVLHRANEAPSPNDPRPAAFLPDLFHAAIDRGADIVVRHGPHVISGIEIYKGKPIFYGMGSVFLDFGGRRILHTPAGEELIVPESWQESFVPVSVFRGHQLQSIKIYPIEIEPNAGERSGMPSIANNEHGKAILLRLKQLSAAYGTNMEIIDGVGVIEVAAK